MDFGQAIVALKAGKSIQRAAWNGKGMHVYLEHDMDWPTPAGSFGGSRQYASCLVLFTAQGIHQPGWNASTPDVLAEDWQIVEHA